MKGKLNVVEGGNLDAVWQHDRSAYSDEDIKFFNEFLETVAKHRPQAAEVIWKVPPENKRLKPALIE